MNISYVELYNPDYHGITNINTSQRYISIFIPFTLDEFYDLNNCILIQSDTRNISLQLVLNYNINGQTFCIIKTGLLIKFQKLWRKYYKQK